MPAYATGQKDSAEGDEPGQESVDDRYRHLQEDIRLRDENMATITARMDASTAKLQTTSVVQPMPRASTSTNLGASAFANLGASASSNPLSGSTYDPTAFLPLP